MRYLLHIIAAILLITPTHVANAGYLERVFYDLITGPNMADLRSAVADPNDFNNLWPNFPIGDGFEQVQPIANIGLQSPADPFPTDASFNNYATYYRGYIQAPLTGEYIFFIASDDESEFYLSTDHSPANLQGSQVFIRDPNTRVMQQDGYAPLAFESGCCTALFTGARLDDRSTDPIPLERGKVYYFEAVQKEGGGQAYLRIGWQRPDGVQEIIPSDVLAPAPLIGATEELALTLVNAFVNDEFGAATDSGLPTPESITVLEGAPARFSVNYKAQQPATFQWLENGTPIADATLAFHDIPVTQLSDSGKTFSVTITDATGATITSQAATLTVTPDDVPPRALSARGSGFHRGIVIRFSEAVDPASATAIANYSVAGQALIIEGAELVSPSSVVLKVTRFTTAPLTVTVQGVTDRSAAGNAVTSTTLNVALNSNLAAYWSFDEATGTDIIDSAGRFHAQLIGDDAGLARSTDVPALGRTNPASLLFDGIDDYVDTPFAGIGGPNPRTVAFWTKSTSTHVDGIVAWGNSGINGGKYHVRVNTGAADGVVGAVRTETQGGRITGSKLINDGQWHHVASVLPPSNAPNNNDVLHYVDGQIDPPSGSGGRAINTDITSANAAPVSIGSRIQGSNRQFFPGAVDDVAIWSVALSAEDLAALAAGKNPIEVGAPQTGTLTITQQPQSLSAFEFSSATFNVEASGSDSTAIGYQWFRNGEPIPGAINPTFTINRVTEADANGSFTVAVFNENGTFNRVISDPAILTFVADTEAPVIESVQAIGGSANRIEITFNEPVDPDTATDLANFQIAGLEILSATLSGDGRQITLATAPQTFEQSYTLQITGITDTTPRANTFSGEATVESTIQYEAEVLADAPVRFWRFAETSGTTVASSVTVLDPITTGIGTVGGGADLTAASLIANDSTDTAIALNATLGQRVLVPNGQDINATAGPWAKKTIELWFNATELPRILDDGSVGAATIFEEGGDSRGLAVYLYGTESSATPLQADLVFNAFNTPADSPGGGWGVAADPKFARIPVVANKLYHVVAVMDGDPSDARLGTLALYVNGDKVATVDSGVGQLFNHVGNVQIGQGNFRRHDGLVADHGSFTGVIDEVALYNAVLPPERIKAHFDAAFAGAVVLGAPEITNQPDSITVVENTTATFTIEFTGTPPWNVTWLKNDEAFLGGAELGVSTFSFNAQASDHNARIKAVVTNELGQATSQEAILTVELETTPPSVTSVRTIGGSVNEIILTFSEPLDADSATTIGNYQIDGLTISSATLSPDGTTLILETSQQTVGTNYSLQLSNIKDRSATGNALTATLGLSSEITYQDEVLADGPAAYWTLGELEGTTAFNLIDPALTGTYASNTGGELPTLGVDRLPLSSIDSAAMFVSANNNYVGLPDSAAVNVGGPYKEKTIELWFKAESLPNWGAASTLPQKMVLWEEGGGSRGLAMYLSGSEFEVNPPRAEIYFHAVNIPVDDGVNGTWGGPGAPVYAMGIVETGKVYHAVFVMQGDDTGAKSGFVQGYLNGQAVTNTPAGVNMGVGLLFNHGDNAAIGAKQNNGRYHDQNRGGAFHDPFNGVIDEVAVYNKVLSPERIQAHYEIGLMEVEVPTDPPMITSIRIEANEVVIDWGDGSAQLQSSTTIDGTFQTIPGATSPYREQLSASGTKFYRLVR